MQERREKKKEWERKGKGKGRGTEGKRNRGETSDDFFYIESKTSFSQWS
jgi:hypothetical protein